MADEPVQQKSEADEFFAPATVAQFEQMMFELGLIDRQIVAIDIRRNQRVAEVDAEIARERRPLVESFNKRYAACMAFASDPANKGRMTTAKAPQTADLTHAKVKWNDDHQGKIVLADGVTEDEAIRALMHRKGGGEYIKTERSLIWSVVRSKAKEATVLAMRHFTRVYNPTSVALYAKPAATPKPDGKAAEKLLKPYS